MRLLPGRGTRLAVLQMESRPSQREDNLKVAAGLLAQAAERGVDLACLPATFATGLNLPTIRADASAADGPVVEFLQGQARRHGMHVAAGVLLSQEREVFDAAVLLAPSGDVLGWYRRASIWAGEADYISAGTPEKVIDSDLGRIGFQVSYDLRFPEASRHYLAQDVDLIVCLANLFAEFSHPVRSICRARAADNECTLAFASSAGHNRFAMMSYLGASMIVDGLVQDAAADPDSDVLAQAPAGAREVLIDAEVQLRRQRKVRERLPFHSDLPSLWSTSRREQR